MVSHPDLLFLEQMVKGNTAGPIEYLEPVQAIEPHRQINILAFVPDRNVPVSEWLKARNLPPQWSGDRADQRHRRDLRDPGERCGHGISGQTKLRLPAQHLAVLCGHLPACGSSHGQTRSNRASNRRMEIVIDSGRVEIEPLVSR